jgi:alkanesulfonate monooxygenase SsuD/methylene tetrahydromethanopterin reductase-like flavin-dependent oxidoreductase (luciferase family)
MQVGIGLPAMIPGTKGDVLIEWAQRAESGQFSSLAALDRLVFPNYEPLTVLAAAAGVTSRVRLMTTVLLAPLRNTAIFAKQAASLDALSGGRLTLGLGIGGREDDFEAAGVPFAQRGRRFEEQLATMKRIWAGESAVEGVGPVGPTPVQTGGPGILIGGYSPRAIQRAARFADGYISGGATPDVAKKGYDVVLKAWSEAGREGRPRFVTSTYFGLGDVEGGRGYLRNYYGEGQLGDAVVNRMLATPEAIKTAIKAFADVGADELVFWPTLADLDEVQRLADLVSSVSA